MLLKQAPEDALSEEAGRGAPVRTHLSKLLSATYARSGRRFKIMLLQAVQEREEKEEAKGGEKPNVP